MTFKVKNVDWGNAKHKLSKIREQVFVHEWRIPKECEFDQQDDVAFHVLVLDEDNREIATGRITPQGEIGRIAVVPAFRGPEVYLELFSALLAIAKQIGLEDVLIQCELEGVKYYQQQGFRPVGSVYMDAGIARQAMTCTINAFSLQRVELTH
jgi:predicted GNAT family N-acyltransferase